MVRLAVSILVFIIVNGAGASAPTGESRQNTGESVKAGELGKTVNRPVDNAPHSADREPAPQKQSDPSIDRGNLNRSIADMNKRVEYERQSHERLASLFDRVVNLQEAADSLSDQARQDLRVKIAEMQVKRDDIDHLLNHLDSERIEGFPNIRKKIDLAMNKLDQDVKQAERQARK